MKYYSTILHKLFNSIPELKEAEAAYNLSVAEEEKRAEEEKKAKEKKQQEADAKEVEEAIDHASNLLINYLKKYGWYSYPFPSENFNGEKNNKPATANMTSDSSFTNILRSFLNN